jgi:hypothetical protein
LHFDTRRAKDCEKTVTSIVVGGQARKVGKTSVAASLISAFSDCPWTAVKISSHRHAGFSGAGDCEIRFETSRLGDSDSSRYLAAGASKSLWVRVSEENFGEAVQQLLPIIQSDPFLIIESNRILDFMEPDLCIMVLKYDVEDFKDSARRMIAKADAAVLVNCASLIPPWEGVCEALSRIPVFPTPDPQILPKGLIELVRDQVLKI